MSVKGIDISNYQNVRDWSAVKASGVEFVIIRAGWGKTNTDPGFKKNIEAALAQGIKVGVYWFLYAKSEADIIKNAAKCDSVIGPYKDKITMKVWADWEYDSDKYFSGLDKKTRTAWVDKFCQELKAKGYEVGVYANKDYLKNYFNDLSQYPLWLAYYANSKGDTKCEIWQKSSNGQVPGISGKVDMDEYFGSFTETAPAPSNPPVQESTNKPAPVTYTVKSGDTLSKIAAKYNTTVDILAAYNGIKDPNKIYVGQVIKIPVPNTTSTSTPSKPRYKVNVAVLNVRAGASTKYKIVRTVKKGEILNIEKVSGSWAKIDGKEEWVYKNFIKLI